MRITRSLTVFAVVLTSVGCNSDSLVPEPDYRDAFEGAYIGQRTSYSWSLGQPSNTVITEDTVFVAAIGDSSVAIDQTTIQIGVDGQFFEQGSASASSYFSGRFFSGDSLETDMNGGGLGGGYHSSFNGKKRSLLP